ncbi:TetR/AcrR family transcriptional regulator [Streptomyces sp. NPDC051940]|uniref:TetR/AcrR family transcriptional regulator n=1 Tax=Streptomyces sp. NPDC051940 TaxID=3155675 RepID=UPI00344971F7
MGHREDLLQGAKRCLLEKGWTRTTARDIVAASGANLASIGYHYGSKDELMGQAYLALMEEWGQRVAALTKETGLPDDPVARRAAMWDAMLRGVGENPGFWQAQLEVISQLGHHEKLKDFFVKAMPMGWEGMLELFEDIPEGAASQELIDSVGWLYSALFAGMWVQHLISPDRTPSGAVIEESLRRIVEGKVARG